VLKAAVVAHDRTPAVPTLEQLIQHARINSAQEMLQ
jgi:hypothetical protein